MHRYEARIAWTRNGAAFTDNRYSRAHQWTFDGGVTVPASASPLTVKAPYSVAEAVDPEEALVAATSSCHMLWFLSLAAQAGFVVDCYADKAFGVMEKYAAGRVAFTRITLRPRIDFAGENRRTAAEVAAERHRAHETCFIPEATEKENLNLWKEMPALDGINRLQLKTSAIPLLESGDGAPYPVVSVGKYGQGRVLVLATDYSWKWRMGMVEKGRGQWAYHRFVERTVRWLTKDPGLESIQVFLPEEGIGRGQRKEIRVRVRSEEESPETRGTVQFSVFDPKGLKIGAELKSSTRPGEYAASFTPEKGGTYKLKVETPGGSVEESVEISEPVEERDGLPDHERLRMIAQSTGGKFLSPREDLLRELLRAAEMKGSRYVEEKRTPLWARFPLWIAVLALLSAEWSFRRRGGLI